MTGSRTVARRSSSRSTPGSPCFVVAMAVLLAVVINPLASITYILGAVLSAAAGYVGMTVATIANARTTEAAKFGPARHCRWRSVVAR